MVFSENKNRMLIVLGEESNLFIVRTLRGGKYLYDLHTAPVTIRNIEELNNSSFAFGDADGTTIRVFTLSQVVFLSSSDPSIILERRILSYPERRTSGLGIFLSADS